MSLRTLANGVFARYQEARSVRSVRTSALARKDARSGWPDYVRSLAGVTARSSGPGVWTRTVRRRPISEETLTGMGGKDNPKVRPA